MKSGKLFRQELMVSDIPADVARNQYEGQAPHDMYIGEVVDILKDEEHSVWI